MILRALIVVLCLCSSQALANPAVLTMITPSPLGIVLTAGHWILKSNNKQSYEIEVEGRGVSAEGSRSNGYRLAVEQAIGSLISSETEVVNGRMQRDEIIVYASGYVERFEIIKSYRTSDGLHRTQMRVWVGRSALADRLLNRSAQSNQVDGARASVQLQTLNEERVTGDRLLAQVLNDFPKRAFDIEFDSTDVVRQNRNSQMEISFRLKWNQDYLRSLWTALEATAYRGSNTVSTVGVNSGGWFGFGGQARFDDTQKYRMVVSAFILTNPAVLVTVRGGHEVLYTTCFYYQELDHQPRYNVTTERFVRVSNYQNYAYVDGTYRMRSRIQLPINPAVLNRVSSVDLDIIPQRQCPNR